MATAQNPAQVTTSSTLQSGLRQQLEARRVRLETIAERASNPELQRLLDEVDAAVDRLEQGTLGICEKCHDFIEPEALMADPLARFCLDHLPPDQQRALEADLELAAELQAKLLPDKQFRADGWQVAYEYRPAGMVSGDYCDLLICPQTNNLYFALGDVSGKGVAASMLMSNLNAMFRALAPVLAGSLPDLMAHANRVFCQSTLPNQYATLILGHATPRGEVEFCNAGHLEPLLIRNNSIESLDGASTPIGLFRQQTFNTTRVQLEPGDVLALFSDGITEAHNGEDEYGSARLGEMLRMYSMRSLEETIAACMKDVRAFQSGPRQADDQALMLLQRAA